MPSQSRTVTRQSIGNNGSTIVVTVTSTTSVRFNGPNPANPQSSDANVSGDGGNGHVEVKEEPEDEVKIKEEPEEEVKIKVEPKEEVEVKEEDKSLSDEVNPTLSFWSLV